VRRPFLILVALLIAVSGAEGQERWQLLPPTPAPVKHDAEGFVTVEGVKLFYATLGHGSPVVLLHGGLASSDYWGSQAAALAPHHLVILMDSRGHGRSGRDSRPFGYDLMADDVVALLDHLQIPRADVVGWSDGAILGLDLALRHPDRVGRIFAFAANTQTIGVEPDVEKNPTFAAFIARASQEYKALSPMPADYSGFLEQIGQMWGREPNWTDADLRSIETPVLIVDGDHDEAIKRDHTEYIAATIPHAGLAILPATSHFAFLQDPVAFNDLLLHFLGDR
jgi:pimeloyl-ACP methyl ester carboxylesterase